MIDKIKKLIVLMPPKTASNSLKETMIQNGIQFLSPIKKTSTPLIHLKLSEIVKLFEVNDLSEYKILQITRDPYTRFVSAYFHLMKITHNVESIKFSNYNFPTFTNHFYESIKSENFIKNFYGNTYFVEHCINNGISWGGTRLFDTQKSWRDVESNISYFKLEDISKEISSVNNLLSTEIFSLSNINKSNLEHKYDSMLTPKIKDIILEVFEEDFNIFGYSS